MRQLSPSVGELRSRMGDPRAHMGDARSRLNEMRSRMGDMRPSLSTGRLQWDLGGERWQMGDRWDQLRRSPSLQRLGSFGSSALERMPSMDRVGSMGTNLGSGVRERWAPVGHRIGQFGHAISSSGSVPAWQRRRGYTGSEDHWQPSADTYGLGPESWLTPPETTLKEEQADGDQNTPSTRRERFAEMVRRATARRACQEEEEAIAQEQLEKELLVP